MDYEFVCFGRYNMNNNLLYTGIKITKGSVKNSNRSNDIKVLCSEHMKWRRRMNNHNQRCLLESGNGTTQTWVSA